MSDTKAKPASAKPDAAAQGGKPRAAGGVVSIGGNYEVDPAQPLAAYNSPGAHAFLARDKSAAGRKLFALVCSGPMPVRLTILQALVGLNSQNLIKLAHSGIVVWPPDEAQRVVMLFEQPAGPRIAGADGRCQKLTYDQICQKLIQPVVSVLRDLETRKIFHGAIRPDNMYALPDLTDGVVLGECVTSPAGYHQPVLYETMQRGLADPSGRGKGHVSDDIYSLGATVVTLVQGHPPLPGLSDEEILNQKLLQGSFYAMVQKQKMPTALLEPLRGMLNDDPHERWTLEDLEAWLAGRRLSPRPPEPPRKAVRPFEFSDREAWEARGLARVLSHDAGTAAQLYEKGEVEAWMRRALGEKNITEIMVAELEAAKTGSKQQREPDILVARCGIAVAPDGPMRVRRRSVYPSGLGTALTEAVVTKRDPGPLVHMLSAGLPGSWNALQKKHKVEPIMPQPDLENVRSLLERKGMGFGVERVLYELDETIPCQSPMLDNFYVLTPNDLLRALERLAPTKSRHGQPIDAHITAFLMVRFRKLEDWLLKALNDTLDPGRSVVAMAQILGSMQERLGNKKLPGIAKWIVAMADPAIDRLHNHNTRQQVKAKINELAEAGMINPIAQVLDDPTTSNADANQYGKAQAKFARVVDEIAKLEDEVNAPDQLEKGFGRELAAVVAGIVGIFAVSGVIGYYFLGFV
ncbi:MAG: serine/threonine-protein kinase [Pseudomonadota bacterium]